MADRRDEFGNLIRTDDQELTGAGTGTGTGAYDPNVGYRAGPEGYGPYGTTGYGVTTGGMYNPPESGFGSETGQQQQQTRPGQQTGYGQGQTGYGSGQTGFRREEGLRISSYELG